MSITTDQLWSHMNTCYEELYYSGKIYVASIIGPQNGDGLHGITKVLPDDKNRHTILNLAVIMITLQKRELSHDDINYCGGKEGFTCSLVYRKSEKNKSEYIFITRRSKPYLLLEDICKKYQIDPTPENKKKVREAIENRVCSYKRRDSEKKERCVTFEDADKLDDYFLNTSAFQMYNEDEELQKLDYMTGKRISELTPNQKIEVSDYITHTSRPVLLFKSKGDSRLLVNEIPDFQTVSYGDLCDILIANTEECSYCKCKMSLLNKGKIKTGISFDAIISLYGHTKDNVTLCCLSCNSKKSFKNEIDF